MKPAVVNRVGTPSMCWHPYAAVLTAVFFRLYHSRYYSHRPCLWLAISSSPGLKQWA